MRRHAGLLGVLLLACFLRVPPVGAGLPYLGYVDEGHVLHPVIHLLKTGGWDPETYLHPTLTVYLIADLAQLARPAYALSHGHSLIADLPSHEKYYDFVFPAEIVLLGRVLIAVLSVATVFLVFDLTDRLGGRRAAILAGLLTALCPALVTRGSIVIVDSVSTFFALSALYFTQRLETPDDLPSRSRTRLSSGWSRNALLAGASAGLAFAAKYTIGVVFLAIAFTVLTRPTRLKERVRLLSLATGAALLASVIAMPALVLRFRAVLSGLLEQSRLYANPALFSPPMGGPGYLGQALEPTELGIPLTAAVAFGLGWMLFKTSTRRTALGWVLFSGALLVPLLSHEYQSFRNILPVVPPLIIAASLALADGLWPRSWGGLSKALTVLVVVGELGFTLARWLPERLRLTDSRTILVRWLPDHSSPDQRILLLEELAVLPSEIAKIPAMVRTVPWLDALDVIQRERFDHIVVGRMDLPDVAGDEWAAYRKRWHHFLATMTIEGATGDSPTPLFPNRWRNNNQYISVRKPSPTPKSIPEETFR